MLRAFPGTSAHRPPVRRACWPSRCAEVPPPPRPDARRPAAGPGGSCGPRTLPEPPPDRRAGASLRDGRLGRPVSPLSSAAPRSRDQASPILGQTLASPILSRLAPRDSGAFHALAVREPPRSPHAGRGLETVDPPGPGDPARPTRGARGPAAPARHRVPVTLASLARFLDTACNCSPDRASRSRRPRTAVESAGRRPASRRGRLPRRRGQR